MFPGPYLAYREATSNPARTTAGTHEQAPPTTAGTDEQPRGGLPRRCPGVTWPAAATAGAVTSTLEGVCRDVPRG